jgi:hypothetical protein
MSVPPQTRPFSTLRGFAVNIKKSQKLKINEKSKKKLIVTKKNLFFKIS